MTERFWKWLAAWEAKEAKWKKPPPGFEEMSKAAQNKTRKRVFQRILPTWLRVLFIVLWISLALLKASGVYHNTPYHALADAVLSCLLLGVMVACCILLLFRYRKALRRELARRPCWECGYSLIGLTEPRCPECGTPFDPAVYERIDAARRTDSLVPNEDEDPMAPTES